MSSHSVSSLVIPAACAGAAICAVVYVVWGPDHFFKKKGRCSGLTNLGNTCFINTILQALAALPGVSQWLDQIVQHKGNLGRALRDILKVLNEDRSDCYSPVKVLQALVKHQWRVDGQEQDAHELYHTLLNILAEEMISCPSLADIVEFNVCSQVWTRSGSVATPTAPLTCPLRGMLSSELHCMQCKHSLPLKYEYFDSISLTMPQYKCTLENCLLEFIKSEMVYDVECLNCSDGCGFPVKRTFLKKLQFVRAPACLCLHFRRTMWVPHGFLHKDNQHMSFPMELDASTLLQRQGRGRGGVRYLLHAVVEHLGGAYSGHYTTYRRCGKEGREWVRASDSLVYAAALDEVLRARAYMLFYCRVDSPKCSVNSSQMALSSS